MDPDFLTIKEKKGSLFIKLSIFEKRSSAAIGPAAVYIICQHRVPLEGTLAQLYVSFVLVFNFVFYN